MSYTVRKLISNAYYLSGLVARSLETVSGQQISDGLDLLNAVLAIKTTDGALIPYYQNNVGAFDTVANQEMYFIENLINLEALTFNFENVRYSMQELNRVDYFGKARVNNVAGLPLSYHCERTFEGCNIYLYFLPNREYSMDITGRYSLSQLDSLDEDLSEIIDLFYIEYLRYALAEYMCNDNGLSFNDQLKSKLLSYELRLRETSPPDLTSQKKSTFMSSPSFNYGDVNIGHLWRPM